MLTNNFARLVALSFLLWQTACTKSAPPVQTYHLGDRVETGSLIYTVLSADWKAQIGEGEKARTPSQRFLLIHLTVTNSGGEAMSMPALTLADDSGQTQNESLGAADIPMPLGLLRNVKPAETLEGNILFDVEPKSYKLKLDDGSDHIAMVEMPLKFDVHQQVLPLPTR